MMYKAKKEFLWFKKDQEIKEPRENWKREGLVYEVVYEDEVVSKEDEVVSKEDEVVSKEDEVVSKEDEAVPDKVSFEDELVAIKGIGRKTASDIVKVFPIKENLLDALDNKLDLPFRDDVVDLLIESFGE